MTAPLSPRATLIEAMATGIHEANRKAAVHPANWPTWKQLLAEGHQGANRVSDTRAQAAAALDSMAFGLPGLGLKVVPVEATDGIREYLGDFYGYRRVYAACIAAAPDVLGAG